MPAQPLLEALDLRSAAKEEILVIGAKGFKSAKRTTGVIVRDLLLDRQRGEAAFEHFAAQGIDLAARGVLLRARRVVQPAGGHSERTPQLARRRRKLLAQYRRSLHKVSVEEGQTLFDILVGWGAIGSREERARAEAAEDRGDGDIACLGKTRARFAERAVDFAVLAHTLVERLGQIVCRL